MNGGVEGAIRAMQLPDVKFVADFTPLSPTNFNTASANMTDNRFRSLPHASSLTFSALLPWSIHMISFL